MRNPSVFLTAEWRKLILINYAVEKDLLLKYLPPFTELDDFNGIHFVSLVGFMFMNTKLKGFDVPFHGKFEEVNLRFYVKYHDGNTWKRGTVFIKEIVPKPAITFIANSVYGENYQTLPMRHSWIEDNDQLKIEYAWKTKNWSKFSVVASPVSQPIIKDSEEEFITEHYWGYTKIGKSKTSEYGVRHPRWETYPIIDYQVETNFEENYGKEFNCLGVTKPSSVILAEGSEIAVMTGRKLTQ